MKTSDQFESLMRTLLAVRDASHSGVPDTLIEEIVAAHIEEPDNPTVHRRVERAIESAVGGHDASD
jgi:hypothetical protein